MPWTHRTHRCLTPYPPYHASACTCSFLNRMLGMCLDDQRLAFDYFSAALDKVESSYKQMGQYDSGGWGRTRQGGGRAAAGSWG